MKTSDVQNIAWDVVVIGGGPAGMMAAGRAAERGAKVLLLEKNNGLGKKLLITGGGRCNVTNAEFDTRKFLSKFKHNDKFLFSAFSIWAVEETLDFFKKHGLDTKIENEKRVFPITDKAESVWQVMVDYIAENNVIVLPKAEVVELLNNGGKIDQVVLKNGTNIRSKSFILATGGKSHPETGSTGDGFLWLETLGHKVYEPKASLVPIALFDKWVKKLSGTTVPNVKISIYQNGNRQTQKIGKILFTHFGISGPTVINLSNEVGELLKYGAVEIRFDFFPNLDPGQLNQELQDLFKKDSNKKFKNSIGTLIPPNLVLTISELAGIDSEKSNHSITREERIRLINILKSLPVEVKGLLGEEKAIVTSGGIELEEVDFKTMRSKLFENLYLVGDVLNIDRPSGGYSLQLCWTTGFVAGDSVQF